MHISYSPKFLKKYRKLSLMIKEFAERKEVIFRADPFDGRLKTHKLKGGLGDLYSFLINNKYRIMFEFIDTDHAHFHTIGTHDIYE